LPPCALPGNRGLSPVMIDGGRAVFKALNTERLCMPKHKHDVFIDECFVAGRVKIEAFMKEEGLFLRRHRVGKTPGLILSR